MCGHQVILLYVVACHNEVAVHSYFVRNIVVNDHVPSGFRVVTRSEPPTYTCIPVT